MAGQHHRPRRRLLVALLPALLAAGCGPELEEDYGTVRGDSINGIAAFVALVRDAGHATVARSTLPPAGPARFDAVVVFAFDPAGLDAEARARIADLLPENGAGTLVVVGRDSDCAIDYWEAVANRADLPAASRDRARVKGAERRGRLTMLVDEAALENVTDREPPLVPVERDAQPAVLPVEVRSSAGDAPRRVDARWCLQRRLEPQLKDRVLWESGADPLLVERRSGPASRLLVASAAPLLNGGLVDPGNRQLAEDLVARLPTRGRVLVAGSGVALDADAAEEPSMFRLLAVPPHPWIAAQALLAMLLFCWWKAPIFGRPRRENPADVQDFGHHVAALGSLLARAHRGRRGDGAAGPDYERQRLEEWRRLAAPPGGKRRKGATPR